MIPNCAKCGQPMRLLWSLSKLKGEKWVTEERYHCSCGYMEDAELPKPVWELVNFSSGL